MLRKALEPIAGPITDEEFYTLLDLATDDIRVNRIREKKRTSIKYLIYVVGTSMIVLQREIKKTA